MSAGRPLPHAAARDHVTGAAAYVDDIPTPAGCLHLAFGLSSSLAFIITCVVLDCNKHKDVCNG